MTAFSESVAAGDDLSAQFRWRLVRARVRARQRRFDEAEALAREGLALVRRSDEIDNQGNALMDLATVLRSAGQDEAATAAVREALALFEAKGNVVSADRARVVLAALGGKVISPA